MTDRMQLYCPWCQAPLYVKIHDGWAIAHCTKCRYVRALPEALREALTEQDRKGRENHGNRL